MGKSPSIAPVLRLKPRWGGADDEERGESKVRRLPLRTIPGAHAAYKTAGDRVTKRLQPEVERQISARLSSC